MSMRMESVAVLRWIPGDVLAAGDDAVADLLEAALSDAVRANGLTPTGPMRIRPTSVDEYPQTATGRRDDDSAVLHLAEVDVDA